MKTAAKALPAACSGARRCPDENLQAPSELSAWVKGVASGSRVTGVIVPAAVAGTEQRFRVLEVEPHAGALYSKHSREVTQYQVRAI